MRKLKQIQVQPAFAPVETPAPAAKPATPQPRAADDSSLEAESPARTLQEKLRDAWIGEDPAPDARWAPASTLLLAGGVSTVVWGLVAWALLGHR